MILSVSLDPKLTKTIMVDDLAKGNKYEIKEVKIAAENGGIDVANVVSEFNEDIFCIGFAGGMSGEQVLKYLNNSLIKNEFIRTKNETRQDISIVAEDGIETRISEISPRVSGQEVDSFYDLYRQAIKGADVICLSGDIPRGMGNDAFSNLMFLGNEEDMQVLVTASGRGAIEALNEGAHLLNIDLGDLEDATDLIIIEDDDIIKLAHNLLEDNIDVIAVYKGKGDYIVVDKKYAYIISLKDEYILSEEGCKESFLAGYAISIGRNYDLDYQLRIAVACHIAKGLECEAGVFDMKKMKSIMNEIDMEIIEI